MNWKRIRRHVRRVWVVSGCLAVLALAWSFQAHGVPEERLRSGSGVRVERDSVIAFTPMQNAQAAGLIFYPGGMVDPDAYAPVASDLARDGFPVRMVTLPWRSAALESQQEILFDATEKILNTTPSVQWVLGGHSRGGALAAEFVHRRGPRVAALILVATTHPKDFDLSRSGLPVTKIYATNDGVAPEEAIRKNADLLPADTRWIRINGGNHAQFGFYGPQLLDGRATISRQRQQEEFVGALRDVLTDVLQRTPSAPPAAHRYTERRHAWIPVVNHRLPPR